MYKISVKKSFFSPYSCVYKLIQQTSANVLFRYSQMLQDLGASSGCILEYSRDSGCSWQSLGGFAIYPQGADSPNIIINVYL